MTRCLCSLGRGGNLKVFPRQSPFPNFKKREIEYLKRLVSYFSISGLFLGRPPFFPFSLDEAFFLSLVRLPKADGQDKIAVGQVVPFL